jgi:hypothetical protein
MAGYGLLLRCGDGITAAERLVKAALLFRSLRP